MSIQLETFTKLPLGGIDRRALLKGLKAEGPATAQAALASARAKVSSAGLSLPEGHCVLMLGGSGGILRSLAIQLIFGEKVPVYAIHYDSARLQIGGHHARALMDAAAEVGVDCTFVNKDATKPDTIANAVAALKEKYQVVHLVNGIAAGATKRYEKYGTTKVHDVDVAFHPLLQVADFSSWDAFRKIGMVDVDIATQADIDRTFKFMGHSTTPWADALAEAGLLKSGESLVAFADYYFEEDDPVYAMGPLAEAKILQRESMEDLEKRHGVRTVSLAYPAMNTTAISAIPGGILMFAGTAQILLENGHYQSLSDLARASIPVFDLGFKEGVARLDTDFASIRKEFHERKLQMTNENIREHLKLVFCNKDL